MINDEVPAMAPPASRAGVLARRRRPITLAAVALSLAMTGGYWLATAGTSSFTISPPAGIPANGAVAEVTSLSTTVTRTNGAATLQSGVAIARIITGSTLANHVRIDIAWTNPSQAAQVLSNPNAQITIGLYHPVHTGDCTTTASLVSGTNAADRVNVTDTDGALYCALLDESAIGSASASSGSLQLATRIVGGYLAPQLDLSGSESACAASTTDGTATCEAATAVAVNSTSSRALFVIASITTPGGIPTGQTATTGSLTFYVGAHRSST